MKLSPLLFLLKATNLTHSCFYFQLCRLPVLNRQKATVQLPTVPETFSLAALISNQRQIQHGCPFQLKLCAIFDSCDHSKVDKPGSAGSLTLFIEIMTAGLVSGSYQCSRGIVRTKVEFLTRARFLP